VRPFYVSSTQTDVPGLAQVIVEFEGTVRIRDTLQEALAAVFGDAPPTLEEPPGGGTTDPQEPTGTLTEQISSLLAEWRDLVDEADAALKDDGDLATYADKMADARAKIEEVERLIEESASTPTDASTTTTSTTEPAASA
jgi:uncharacterized membrane protein (UPF0182 family)